VRHRRRNAFIRSRRRSWRYTGATTGSSPSGRHAGSSTECGRCPRCWGPWFDPASQFAHHGYQRLSRSSGLHRPRCLRAPDPRASGGAVGARSCGATALRSRWLRKQLMSRLSAQYPSTPRCCAPLASRRRALPGRGLRPSGLRAPISANHLGTVAARSRVCTWFASHVTIGAQRSR
jgi:hypothetical protein